MYWLPQRDLTLVSPLSADEVIQKIAVRTRQTEQSQPGEWYFNGSFWELGFRISMIIRHSSNSLPLVKGRVESAPSGSIVFLRFRLFPAASLFLYTFTTLCFGLGGLLSWGHHSIVYLVAGGALALANHWVLTENFRRKAETTFQLIQHCLSTQ